MISIRKATEDDIPVIKEIMDDVLNWLASTGRPLWEREDVSWRGLSKYYQIGDFYIASLEEKPMGLMALVDHDPAFWPDIQKGGSLFIHKLAVKRQGAKQGVSQALIGFAKEEAIRHGIYEVRLDTHRFRPKVRTLYEGEGFVCVGEKCLFEKYHPAFYVWKAPRPLLDF